jgi:hypothetical protein
MMSSRNHQLSKEQQQAEEFDTLMDENAFKMGSKEEQSEP